MILVSIKSSSIINIFHKPLPKFLLHLYLCSIFLHRETLFGSHVSTDSFFDSCCDSQFLLVLRWIRHSRMSAIQNKTLLLC